MIYFKEESYCITGAALHVYNVLGAGFLEAVYQEALELEFQKRGIPYEREKELTITYDGHKLCQTYKADFVCYNNIIVELKAVKTSTTSIERKFSIISKLQVLNWAYFSTLATPQNSNTNEK